MIYDGPSVIVQSLYNMPLTPGAFGMPTALEYLTEEVEMSPCLQESLSDGDVNKGATPKEVCKCLCRTHYSEFLGNFQEDWTKDFYVFIFLFLKGAFR